MSVKGRESAQRLLAIIVIVAMLVVMGIPHSVVVFFAILTYFIWRAVHRSEHQETGRIFEFYIAANDILRDEERRWYGFEIAEVIERGERVLHSMEVNLSPAGEVDMEPDALARLDLVLGAFHSALRRTQDQTPRYLAALR